MADALELLREAVAHAKEQAAAVERAAAAARWKPMRRPDGSKHPQQQAMESPADILGYGGAAGGGKSDLLLGLAGWYHYRSIIFRRVFPSLRGLIDRSREVYNPDGVNAAKDPYNESLYRWRFPWNKGASLRFGSLQHEKDVQAWQGQPHDFYGFDELTEFTEHQFRFVTGWNRTTRAGQRTRVVGTMNPPTSKEGEWVIRFFAPWLDDKHPNPAKEGELRWFTTVDGKDVEQPNGKPVLMKDERTGREEWVTPKSRTFIFARVTDNPYLVASGYISTLQSLPEPLRSKMLYGDFKAGMLEDPWQLFPSAWVRAAMERWAAVKEEPKELPIDQLGIDVARGGQDRTVYTQRRSWYFCKQHVYPGAQTPTGAHVVGLAEPLVDPHTKVCVDAIGVGSSPVDFAGANGMNVIPMNGSERTDGRTKAGQLGFFNRRAEWHWRLREALDPAAGEDIALPDDPELYADLTAIRWEATTRGVKVRDKDEIKVLLGRSPDKGESLIYAYGQVTGAQTGLLDYYREQSEALKKAQEAKA